MFKGVGAGALHPANLPPDPRNKGLRFSPISYIMPHFRTDVLRKVGGWDAYNVTEDADLGFRLTARGFRGGAISRPTYEDAPIHLDDWLPQRTRWIKGYMQTWGVHTRGVRLSSLATVMGMQLSLGLGILGAAFHGPFVLLLMASALIDVCSGHNPYFSAPDTALLVSAWGSAIIVKAMGARRAGLRMRLVDGLAAPAYWPLQSLAFLFAVTQLIHSPFHWDKTNHVPHSASRGGEPEPVRLDAPAPARVSRAA